MKTLPAIEGGTHALNRQYLVFGEPNPGDSVLTFTTNNRTCTPRSFHGNCENAEWASERMLSVSLAPQRSDDNVSRIIEGIMKVLDHYKR